MNQDLSALEKQTARGNIGAEDASNRVTSIDENSTDTQYPSAKCVFNALQNVGGGYKDGGALVDGDFIKVENNSVSTYTNTSRTDINYYFEVQDGEVLNAVIELTNQYNATVHVYILQNGFYIPLGNVGGDTVNAGDDYKINIVGNSFMLEVVTPSQAVPDFVELNGNTYGVLNVNGLLWLKNDYKGVIENIQYGVFDGHYYYNLQDMPGNFNINGWRLPLNSEQNNLLNFCNNDYNTFVSNMNIGLNGVQSNKTGGMSYYGSFGFIANKNREIVAGSNSVSIGGYRANTRYNLRLVYEL